MDVAVVVAGSVVAVVVAAIVVAVVVEIFQLPTRGDYKIHTHGCRHPNSLPPSMIWPLSNRSQPQMQRKRSELTDMSELTKQKTSPAVMVALTSSSVGNFCSLWMSRVPAK